MVCANSANQIFFSVSTSGESNPRLFRFQARFTVTPCFATPIPGFFLGWNSHLRVLVSVHVKRSLVPYSQIHSPYSYDLLLRRAFFSEWTLLEVTPVEIQSTTTLSASKIRARSPS